MKMFKFAAASLIAISAVTAVQAEDKVLHMIQCGSQDWGGSFSEKHIKQWEDANPGYKVNLEYLAWGQCQTKATTLAAAGNAPALAYMGSRTLKQLAKNDLIIPLNMTAEEKASYAAPILGTITYDGKEWGAPRAFSTKGLYWNKGLFKQAGLDPETPPKTWDEMYTMAKAITDKTDSYGVALVAASFDNTMHQFMSYAYSNGAQVLDENGDVVFNSPQMVEAMEFYGKLATVSQPGPIAYDRAKARPLFLEGKAGFLVAAYSDGARMNAKEGLEWGVARNPHGPSGKPSTLLITDSLAVFKGTGVEEQAVSLAKFLTNPENQLEFEIATGLTPLRRSAEVDAMIAKDPNWAPFIDSIPDGGPEPFATDYQGLQDAINDAIQSVILGKATAAEAVATAAEDLEDTK